MKDGPVACPASLDLGETGVLVVRDLAVRVEVLWVIERVVDGVVDVFD